jgi:hypothetical protein
MTEQERHRVLSPLLVGVVGHTRLRQEDVPLLSGKVREILQGFREKYPHTPVVVVSSLAEGADQICADVALELGMEVIAPLPFPPDLYETRFKNEAAKARLRQLSQDSHVRIFYPGSTDGKDIDFASIIKDDDLRGQRYAEAAIFVSRHSHAMLALWDGEEKSSLTAKLIEFKTLGRTPSGVDPIKFPPELGIVYHIFTPRPGWTPEKGGTPGEIKILPTDAGEGSDRNSRTDPQKLFAQTCHLTESLNREIADCPRPSANDLLKSDEGCCTSVENDLAAFRRLVANQSYRYKSQVDVAYRAVFLLVALGALFLHAYGHSFDPDAGELLLKPWMFLVSLGCFFFAWLYPTVFHTRQDEQRRLDYRALAEALRVQAYWHYAGLMAWVPDHYLQRQRSELDWIRQSTRAWSLRLQAENNRTPANDPKRLTAVTGLWLKEQTNFYEKSHRKNEASNGFWRRISKGSLYGAMTLVVLLLWPLSMTHPPHYPIPILTVLSAFLLIAAMTLAYAEKQLYAEHARHFCAMRDLFHSTEKQCGRFLEDGHPEVVSALLQQMGKEALSENTEWLILHRVRHFEVPPAG